jgi:hypothetical protein
MGALGSNMGRSGDNGVCKSEEGGVDSSIGLEGAEG